MPAGGGEPAEQRGARRRLVEMHRLRIELGGEGDDLLARHQARAVDGDVAGSKSSKWRFAFIVVITRAGG